MILPSSEARPQYIFELFCLATYFNNLHSVLQYLKITPKSLISQQSNTYSDYWLNEWITRAKRARFIFQHILEVQILFRSFNVATHFPREIYSFNQYSLNIWFSLRQKCKSYFLQLNQNSKIFTSNMSSLRSHWYCHSFNSLNIWNFRFQKMLILVTSLALKSRGIAKMSQDSFMQYSVLLCLEITPCC